MRGLGDFTQTYFMGYVGRRVVTRLRGEVFRRVLQFPISYFDRNSSGTLLSRLTYNTEQIGSATTDSVVSVVTTTLTILGSIGYLLWLNTRLALFALTIGPLMGWLISVINRRFRRYSRRIQDSVGDVTRVSKESFEAPRLIKVYNAQDASQPPVRRREPAQPALQHAPGSDPQPREPDRATRDRTRRCRRPLYSHRGRNRRPHDDGLVCSDSSPR